MRIELTQAYVLHRRPYKESSLLVEAYTRDLGRVGLIARGARKSRRSSRSSILQHYVPLRIGFAGRGELRTLTQVEADGPQILPSASRNAMVALYLNELLLRLTPREDPHPALFDSYVGTLRSLSANGAESALRRFELDLLEALGYGLELGVDANSGTPVVSEEEYCYQVEHGPVSTSQSRQGVAVRGSTLLALEARDFRDAGTRYESRQLLRSVISHHLGGRPLKTRELLKKLSGTHIK